VKLRMYRVLVGWRDPLGNDPDEIVESAIYPVMGSGEPAILRHIADQVEKGAHPALPATAEIATVTFLSTSNVLDLAGMTSR